MELAVFAGLAVLLVLVRHVAARRVAAGDGRFVWLGFLPSLLGCGALILIGARTAGASPILGLVMTAVGLVLLVAMIRAFTRMSAGVSATPPGGDVTDALMGPLTDVTLLWGVLLAVLALVAVVVLIAWGVLMAAGA